MDWADELAASVSGPQVVNDSKTPSGTVHVGSLRGPVVHDAVWRALLDHGVEAQFLYGVDDMDAMDAASLLTPDAVDRSMGVPLARVPAPESSSALSYARHFVGNLFFPTFARLGIRPKFYWMSDLYGSGAFDPHIRVALDRADRVREIYRTVSHVEKPAGWLPLQPICESCGRVGTTIARDWDGETVAYECQPHLVTWATGCGHRGRISPFGGRATLPWNLDWAAKWSHFSVTIEGCGKDLATAGGSRDRSDAIAREVFEREPPLNVTYEFLNVGGRKMSTSKGRGAAAHTIAEVVPPEQLRFLFLRPRPNQAIEFDPDGTDAIPRLFDEFDRIAAAAGGREVKGELPPNPRRLFALSLVDPAADIDAEAALCRPPFLHLSLIVQAGKDPRTYFEAEKGSSLTPREQDLLRERIESVSIWLMNFAPDGAKYRVAVAALPAEAARLADEQRLCLLALARAAEMHPPATGDDWQTLVFGIAAEAGLPAGRVFGALYVAFLGRPNGPRAGWLLASLQPAFVLERLREAGGVRAGSRPADA
ncbi:MAG TPA: lysine--tRNA ligase [Candidatus Saccharimonadales bacterium]|nr:lysine--tRNA ligase [Candidatus Saccharimonadales bacterium]